jgi:hypothetical protein
MRKNIFPRIAFQKEKGYCVDQILGNIIFVKYINPIFIRDIFFYKNFITIKL